MSTYKTYNEIEIWIQKRIDELEKELAKEKMKLANLIIKYIDSYDNNLLIKQNIRGE